MIRTLIAAALSLTLALPLTTTPAQAQLDGRDAAQILGGLAALYVLKEALERRDDRRVHRAPTYRAPLARDRHAPRHAPRQQNVKRVPDQCARYLNTANGRVLAYGARCMQNRVARPGTLPPQCIRQVRTDRGVRTVYGRHCLRRDGWAMARR